MADEHKAKGNAAFSAGNFEEAIQHFTKGLEVDPRNHILYSNRSAAEASLKLYEEALEDAQKCIELKPEFAKGFSRLGAAYFGLAQWDDAIAAYEQGLKLDPSSAQMQNALEEAKSAKAAPPRPAFGGGGGGLFGGPEVLAKLAMDPRTKGFLGQPDFMRMLTDVQSNPANMNAYLRDPRFKLVLEVVLGLKMSTGDEFAKQGGFGAEEDETSTADAPPPKRSSQPSAPPPPPPPPPAPEVEMSDAEREAVSSKAQATKEKELGNEAYKAKDFEVALQHYGRALELFDGDISYLTNRAAVLYEMGRYEDAITDCDAAVEKGRELRTDYKMVAKAITRKGNALVKLGRLEDAINVYNKSLMEHRNADTLKKLHDTEKALKDKREAEYVDMDKANEEREQGNTAFKEQRYPEAIKHYLEALKRGPPSVNPEAYKLYSNLAACYTKLGAYPEGVKVADKCIELAPAFVKGYSRKGTLQYFMKEYDKAMETYQKGLAVEPDNEELKEGMQKCMSAIGRFATGLAGEDEVKERQQRSMADPEVQNILKDPVMQQVLRDFQDDPKSAQHHLKNADILKKINKLVAAGIIQMR